MKTYNWKTYTWESFAFSMILSILNVLIAHSIDPKGTNPLLWPIVWVVSGIIGLATPTIHYLIFDTSHLPRKKKYSDEQIALLEKKGYKVLMDNVLISLPALLNIASKNDFVVTFDCIVDNQTGIKYNIDYKAAEAMLTGSKSPLIVEYKEAIIRNRAIRMTLRQIERFNQILLEMNPITADLQ